MPSVSLRELTRQRAREFRYAHRRIGESNIPHMADEEYASAP